MNFKQILLGNRIGEFAMFARRRVELLRAAIFQPEAVGTLANDQLAGLLVASICDGRKTFLDVGAHIGSVMSAVRLHNRSVRMIGVEAMPDKADNLRRKFPDAIIHGCAVAESSGDTVFYIDMRRTGYSSLIRPVGNPKGVREIVVPVKRLDDIIPDSDIDVVKMDIEGAELGALRGATGLLSRNSPVVMFESGPQKLGSRFGKNDLFRYFQQKDYVIIVPNRLAHNGCGLTEEGFLEGHLYPRRATNYFAIPMCRRKEIRNRARRILGIHVD
jgi:FkbM family methyltransferase